MKRRGFTLIEIMIAVAIIGVLAGVATPIYQGYQTKAKQAKVSVPLEAIASYFDMRISEGASFNCAPDNSDGHIPKKIANFDQLTEDKVTIHIYQCDGSKTYKLRGYVEGVTSNFLTIDQDGTKGSGGKFSW